MNNYNILSVSEKCNLFNNYCINPATVKSPIYRQCVPDNGNQFPTRYATCECNNCPLQVNVECSFDDYYRIFSWKKTGSQPACCKYYNYCK
jgi:hypothetical protein